MGTRDDSVRRYYEGPVRFVIRFGLVLGDFREISRKYGFLCIGYCQKGRHFYY